MTSPLRKIATHVIRDLTFDIADLEAPLAFGVAIDGEILLAGRLRNAKLYDERAGARFPKSMLDEPHDWTVVRARGTGDVRRIHVRGERPSFSYVDAVGDGILLVAARCSWQRKGAEKNAVVLSQDGTVQRRFTLGDGIQDLRVSPSNEIWVSYFDEGIFGNRGWNNPGPEPIGSAGLVCFGPSGERRVDYDAAAAGTDTICDAYAMNVDRDGEIWICFYTEFPIVRLHEGRYTRWSYGTAGASVIAAWETRALLIGDYGAPERARVVELRHDGTTRVIEELTVVTPEGAPIGSMRAVAIGSDVYFFDGRRVLGLSDWC